MAKDDFYRGSVADDYEQRRSSSPVWHKEDEILESMLTKVRSTGPTYVLDVPIGTGRFIPLFDKLGYQLIGFDISDEMLGQADSHSSSERLLAVADIRQLPLRNQETDIVVCIRFTHLVSRSTLKAAVSELSRVVRTGGFLIISARLHGWDPSVGLLARMRFAFGRAYTLLRFKLGKANSRSHRIRGFQRILSRHGLAVLDVQHVNRTSVGAKYEIFLLQSIGPHDKGVRRPVSIEMFGLPGVGKSTLFRSIEDQPSVRFSDGFSAIGELSFWSCIRARPIAATRLLARLLPHWRELSRLAAKKATVAALRQLVAQAQHGAPVCLFQEGVSHEVWRQLVESGGMSDKLLAKLLPVADLTVLVDAPLDVVKSRLAMKKSPGPISRELIREDIGGDLWQRGVSDYERVCTAISTGGGRTVVLPNHGELENGIRLLTKIVADAQSDLTGDPRHSQRSTLA